jgi:tellurite resistance protein
MMKRLAITLFGCPLGLLGLTLVTLHIETTFGFTHVSGAALLVFTILLFALVAFAYLVKAVTQPSLVRSDWNHPVQSNFFAVISGILVLFGLAILPFSSSVALPFWAIGAFAHLAVTLGIASKWVGATVFNADSLSPALFLPAVGNVLVPLAGVSLGFTQLSWFFFSAGLVLWAVLLPIIIWRLLMHSALPDGLLPTLVILMAPPSLLMLDYQRLDPDGSQAILKILYYVSFLFFLIVLTQVPRLSRIDFSLAWWAYTFPTAAFTIGTLTFAQISGVPGFVVFGAILYIVLIGLVLVVLWKTLRFLLDGKLFAPVAPAEPSEPTKSA